MASLILCLILVVGCRPTSLAGGFEETPVEHASGWYAGVAWLPDGRLVVSELIEAESSARLAEITAAGDLEPWTLDERPECSRIDYLRPALLPDGRLGVLRGCQGFEESELPPAGLFELVAVNDDLTQEVLVEVPSSVSTFAWTPDMRRAVIGFGSVICQTVAWVDEDGFEPLNVTLDEPDGVVVNGGPETGSSDCPEVWADRPALSPDGAQLAFFARPGTVGTEGPARLGEQANLYVVDVGASTAASIARGISAPRSLRWSPDGTRLGFGGGIGAPEGTWLVDLTSEELQQIHDASLGSLAWSLDGDELVGIFEAGIRETPRTTQLIVLSGKPRETE